MIGAFGTVTKGLLIGLGDMEVGGRADTNPNYSIAENGQNTEKSSGNLRLTVTRNLMKDHHLTLMWENSK